MSEKPEAEKIEYEQVSVNIPKAVMEYFRTMYSDPKEYLERMIVDSTRAEIEALHPEELFEILNLNRAFKVVLG